MNVKSLNRHIPNWVRTPDKTVRVISCFTAHQGKPMPMTTIAFISSHYLSDFRIWRVLAEYLWIRDSYEVVVNWSKSLTGVGGHVSKVNHSHRWWGSAGCLWENSFALQVNRGPFVFTAWWLASPRVNDSWDNTADPLCGLLVHRIFSKKYIGKVFTDFQQFEKTADKSYSLEILRNINEKHLCG